MKLTLRTICLLLPFLVAASTDASGQSKPDLAVSSIVISRDGSGQLVERVSVTVTNMCNESVATGSYLLLTFKVSEHRDAKTIYYVGNRVPRLRGGESFTQDFDTASLKIGFGRHVMAEVDPYKKVAEANEGNNWRSLFPDAAGTAGGSDGCSTRK